MKSIVIKIVGSKLLSLGLLLIYALLLAIATFVEKQSGTAHAKELIYHSPALFALQAIMVVNFIAIMLQGEYIRSKRFGMLTVHAAFIVILAGAFITHTTGREGVIHLREGERSNTMVIQTPELQQIVTLPFEIELTEFVLTRYLGSMSPSSYESFVTIYQGGSSSEAHIYMNNTLDVAGYRLFQASYDQDERGSILIVNQDVAGRRVTYVGYTLLAIGLLLSLFRGRGRTLLKKLAQVRAMALLLTLSTLSATANNIEYLDIVERHTVPEQQAAAFGALPMQDSHGRIVPINTFASQVVRKLHKQERVGDLTPEQFLLSLWLMPDVWINIPFIESEQGYRSYVEMFDSEENYIYENQLTAIYAKGANERTAEDKEVLKVDERVNILNQLFNHRMVNMLPLQGDKEQRWYAPGDDLAAFNAEDSLFVSRIFHWYLTEVGEALSSGGDWSEVDRVREMISTYQRVKGELSDADYKRVEQEIRYNRLNAFAKTRTYYLILGGLLLILSIFELFYPRKWVKWAIVALGIGVLLAFHFHMLGISLRWRIAQYAPWSNSYETMVYIAWVAVMAGILFARKNTFVFGVSTLFGGVVLFVSGLSWMEPQITPLVPVLKSVWLMIHVAVIVAAYGLFGISFLLGLTNLIMMIIRGSNESRAADRGIEELTIINEITLWYGLALMAAGTFLGAIWANESWGRYWGWDPKETWALITMVVYAVVLHLYHTKFGTRLIFAALSLISFASVLMTFFGVNFYLSGMHSYGSNSEVSIPIVIGVSLLIATLIGVAAARNRK